MSAPPPLNAIRAFEVAARSGSFVQAGAELGVTSAAVSQQVKALEVHLGKRLFLRQGNRIALTDAGRAIYPRIEAALGELAAVTAELMSGRDRARLIVSVLPSVAELFLAPALRGFDGLGGVEVRIEEDPVIFARDGVDLRITYGAHAYPDHHAETLFRDRLVPVAAPGFAAPECGLKHLPDGAFIHTNWGPAYATQPSWAAWFASKGLSRRPELRAGLNVGTTSFAVAAARAGLGVALVPERIAGGEIGSGCLVLANPGALTMSWDYVLVWPHALQRKPSLRALIAHLKARAVEGSDDGLEDRA
ncbi:Glycine cleavage system transcriptional activator [Defluviimonas aquaemixtae]|uniref:Glycine cleavage system transcriptional activator n=1 Tax=Albidovulum aquaemixtae TaxID=1542388 RepID=A0A2R8BLP6_9RHOB|nr:LysR substrate-binding domain-containing protein [Defluviimonas aquaemixtae]SPH24342.1 Glycine cleavage system transcriptional activator [Defluviimonas aquaemixtae]